VARPASKKAIYSVRQALLWLLLRLIDIYVYGIIITRYSRRAARHLGSVHFLVLVKYGASGSRCGYMVGGSILLGLGITTAWFTCG